MCFKPQPSSSLCEDILCMIWCHSCLLCQELNEMELREALGAPQQLSLPGAPMFVQVRNIKHRQHWQRTDYVRTPIAVASVHCVCG